MSGEIKGDIFLKYIKSEKRKTRNKNLKEYNKNQLYP